MQALPHRDLEEVDLILRVTIPARVLRKLDSIEHLSGMTGVQTAAAYAAACLRTFDRPAWDSGVIERMTDKQLEEAIEEMVSEREVRAMLADECGEPEEEPSIDSPREMRRNSLT